MALRRGCCRSGWRHCSWAAKRKAVTARGDCTTNHSLRPRLSRRKCRALDFRLEHRVLAPHQRVAILCERQPALGLELVELAAVHALPRPLMLDLYRDDLVEGAVAADHEHVVVGDGAEGLV